MILDDTQNRKITMRKYEIWHHNYQLIWVCRCAEGSSLAIVCMLSGGNALSSRPQLLHPEGEGDGFLHGINKDARR